MVPKVSTGKGFIGAYSYFSADQRTAKERESKIAKTSNERVLFAETLNMAGLEANRATAHLMKETAKQNKRCEKPVYTFSLSWSPEEQPSQEQMKAVALEALKVLRMEEHQAMIFAHNDTQHPHIHVLANRIHPETLKAANNFQDFKRLSAWAINYEREQGKIYCPEREARAAEREQNQGQNQHRYAENTLTKAWSHSDNGKAFQAALEEKGWKFGLGDNNKNKFLAVSPSGKPLDILRELNKTLDKGQKLRAADIERRFADLNRDQLKYVEDLQAELEKQRETAKSHETQAKIKVEQDKTQAAQRERENQTNIAALQAEQQKQPEAAKTQEAQAQTQPTPKSRPRYDYKAEKQDRLNKIDESKARAAKRTENAALREQPQPEKTFQQSHDDIQTIRQQHNNLTAQHREQQRLLYLDINRKRQQCAQDLENYKLDEKKQQLRDAQERLNAKPTLIGKLTGKYKREQEKTREEIQNLSKNLADAKKRAAEWQQRQESQIREKTNALNERQKQERQALPPLPEREKNRGQEQEQKNSPERSRDWGGYER